MPTLDQLFTPEVLVPIATFLAIMLGGWAVLSAVAGGAGSADDRLDRLVEQTRLGGARRLVAEADRRRLQDRIAEAATKLSGAVQPKDEAELGKARVKLLNAGFRHPQAVQIYFGMKALSALLALGVAGPAVLSHYGLNRPGISALVAAAGIGFYLPGIAVAMRTKGRQQSIFLGLPDALDLMVVCVEAGLGFDAAMRRVTGELAEACPVLCDELNIVNFQVQMGRPRREALRDLGVRTGVDDVRALAGVIIQAEKFGSSIGQALRVQSDTMRTRRKQLAEEKAAKTAVKIMIPLVLFIFPGVFIVLVGPAAINIMETMMK